MTDEEMQDIMNTFQKALEHSSNPERAPNPLRKNKPKHWSAKSNAPYYRPIYGELAKRIIDRMVTVNKPQIYFYKDCGGLSPNTIINRFHQGLAYLIDHDDPQETYLNLKTMIRVEKLRGVGIQISLRKDILEAEKSQDNLDRFMPKDLLEASNDWKEKMEAWFSSAPVGVPFEVMGLALSQEEISDIEAQLNGLPGIVYNIDRARIKIVKIECTI